MKSGHNALAYITVTLLMLFCLGTTGAGAQEGNPDIMDISCKVTLINKAADKKEFTESVTYALFSSKSKADEVAGRIERIFRDSDPMKVDENIKKIKRAEKIVRTSKPNGRFTAKVLPGMGVIVIGENDGVVSAFEVKPGKTEYPIVFEVNRTVGTSVKGNRKLKPRTTIIETDNGEEMFRIQIPIDEDLIKESSRLIIQTYAIDCLTDDTIAYCRPIVYEESEYHDLQDKRMDYDFFKNDKLAVGYSTGGIPTFIDTMIVYEKPDKKRSYKGPSKYVIEDYHHVYFENVVGGSCLRIRPFKFLDFSVAIPEMALTEDFHEIADVVVDNVQTDLHLKFVQGKDELTEDSINDVERAKIVRELQSYGTELLTPTIIGTASPEGSEKINRELADKRARKARAFISPYLSSRARPNVQTKIYTWGDLADELAKRRRTDEAQAVREAIATNSGNKPALDRAIRELPFYEASVVPIMDNMRVMKCVYSYVKQHVMEPDEAVDAYYRNKKAYLSGEKSLSSGDYYNIYSLITDTMELDTVTIMAYNWLKKKSEDALYGEKIAPYVYYRMARLLQRHGTPDTLLLAPFIDDSVGIDITTIKEGVPVKMNRQDIYVAQAMNYYLLQKFSKAQEYINYLKDYGKTPQGLDKLEMFMTLKNKFGRAEDDEDFIKAKEFVLNSSDENKAILYTEVPDWRISFEDTDDLINRLENNNPKKWYLKGILWATKADTEPDLSEFYADEDDGGFHKLSMEEEDNLMVKDPAAYAKYRLDLEAYNEAHKDDPQPTEVVEEESVSTVGIKHYLAYFHRSFQIEPTFKRLYYNEGHIDEEMRKKHKYLKKDFAGYEEVFKLLQVRDDRRREELMPANDGEDITDHENTENTGTTEAKAPSDSRSSQEPQPSEPTL